MQEVVFQQKIQKYYKKQQLHYILFLMILKEKLISSLILWMIYKEHLK